MLIHRDFLGESGYSFSSFMKLIIFFGQLSCPYVDADTFHSEENIAKMKQGIALTDEVNVFLKYTVLLLMIGSLLLMNRFHVAVHLFNKRPQMMSKCSKNKKVVHEAQESVSVMFLLHFDLFCNLLLYSSTETWNLFV